MKNIVHKHTISFRHAIDGLVWALRTQPNYRVHVIVSSLVVAAGIFFNVSRFEWIILIILMMMGLVIETINTAIESATDAITYEWREEIKRAKDASAAAMLTYAVGAAIVGIFIFGQRIL